MFKKDPYVRKNTCLFFSIIFPRVKTCHGKRGQRLRWAEGVEGAEGG